MADKDVLKEDDDKLDDYVIVEEPPAAPEAEKPEAPAPKAAADDRDDDDDDGEDDRIADADATDAEREALREQRRNEKRARREARRAAMERDKRMLTELAQQNRLLAERLAQLEGRSVQQDVLTIDSKLNDAVYEMRAAEQVLAKAIEANNGEDVARALRIRDEARDRAAHLHALKERAAASVPQQPQRPAQPSAPAPDPEVISQAQRWAAKNDWYNPQAGDEDSRIALAIDQTLAAEGYDPRSADYWSELDKRIARRLPHRAQATAQQQGTGTPGARRGPPVGTGREHVPQSTRREVYISPERKQAMMDAGAWDDPEKRKRFLKAYAEYDRNSAKR